MGSFLENAIMGLFGGTQAVSEISKVVIQLISAIVAITPNHVNNFLFNGFVKKMIYVFFGIGTGILLIQSTGYMIKYINSVIGNFAQYSPMVILQQIVKTIILSLFYPLIVCRLIEMSAQFTINILASHVMNGGLSFSGISTNVTIAGVAIGIILRIPIVAIALLITEILIFVILLWDLFMDLVKFTILTAISPLLISLDFSGLGTFQMVFTKQVGIALAQVVRIWLFGIALGPALTSQEGILASIALMILAISINKLIDLAGGSSGGISMSSVVGLAASPITSGASSAIMKVGGSVAGKLGGTLGSLF